MSHLNFLLLSIAALFFPVQSSCEYGKCDKKAHVDFKEDEPQKVESLQGFQKPKRNNLPITPNTPTFTFNRRQVTLSENNFSDNSSQHRENLSGLLVKHIDSEIVDCEVRLTQARKKLATYKEGGISQMEQAMKEKLQIFSLETQLEDLKAQKRQNAMNQ